MLSQYFVTIETREEYDTDSYSRIAGELTNALHSALTTAHSHSSRLCGRSRRSIAPQASRRIYSCCALCYTHRTAVRPDTVSQTRVENCRAAPCGARCAMRYTAVCAGPRALASPERVTRDREPRVARGRAETETRETEIRVSEMVVSIAEQRS